MFLRLSLTLCLLASGLSANAAPSMDHQISRRVIVFGDSYSDNGNDFALTNNRYPNAIAYFNGRFSNGPVWSEYFAKKLGVNPNDATHFLNYAYGQAKILQPTQITVHTGGDKTYAIPDLAGEINEFITQQAHFTEHDIVVVFISTNDFFDLTPTTTHTFFSNAADHQTQQIERLVGLGAKHIVVLNGRDVTLSPLAITVARAQTEPSSPEKIAAYLEKFRQYIKLYNRRLAKQLAALPQVTLYDIYKFDHRIFNKMHNSEMCYQNPQGDYENVAGPICEHPETFFFYDRIHTTRIVNQWLADDVYQQVNSLLNAESGDNP